MPKPTFLNLPAQKRDRIVALAIEEFSERSFHRASLSRIVARAGIAKGSIYQYFDNKLDLYRWLLLEEAPRRKLASLRVPDGDAAPAVALRDFLRGAVMAGIDFMLAEPRLASIAISVTQPTDDPNLQVLYREVLADGHARFVAMLHGMRDAGQIRDDVELDLVARVLSAVLGRGLGQIVLGRLGIDFMQLMRDPNAGANLRRDELEALIEDLLRVLLEGVAPANR